MSAANYPRFVYKSPGNSNCQGGTYDHKAVEDEEDHAEALTQGWSDSVPEALAAVKNIKKAPNSPDAGAGAGKSNNPKPDNAPPTRAEMEEQARKLGISFQPNISDKKLLERIELKMQSGA